MTTPPEYDLAAVMPEPPRKRRTGLIVGVIIALLAVGGLGTLSVLLVRADKDPSPVAPSAAPAANLGNPLRGAQQGCDSQQMGTRIEDDGKTLIIDNTGEEDYPASSVDLITLRCLLGRLSTPAAVVAQMEATRALDGRQQAEWGRYSASWSYHPNTGLDLIVTLVD